MADAQQPTNEVALCLNQNFRYGEFSILKWKKKYWPKDDQMFENESLVEEASTYLKNSKHMLYEGLNLISIFSDSPMSLLLLL